MGVKKKIWINPEEIVLAVPDGLDSKVLEIYLKQGIRLTVRDFDLRCLLGRLTIMDCEVISVD